MEFSIVDGQRRVAEPNLKGVCDVCGGETISKCGNIRIHHWAHRRGQNCDPWWENETQWHREWKRRFPEQCREVTVTSNDGVRHRADVRTDSGRVIEFQHSPIGLEARLARESFYDEMVWVIDGLRLQNFAMSFDDQLTQARVLQNSPIKIVVPKGNCSLLKTWADSKVGVYLDFGDTKFTDNRFKFSKSTLWRLYPGSSSTQAELAPVLRDEFAKAALSGSSTNGIHDPKLTVNGVYDPELTVAPESETVALNPNIVRKAQKFRRRESESDLEYAIRVWNFPGIS